VEEEKEELNDASNSFVDGQGQLLAEGDEILVTPGNKKYKGDTTTFLSKNVEKVGVDSDTITAHASKHAEKGKKKKKPSGKKSPKRKSLLASLPAPSSLRRMLSDGRKGSEGPAEAEVAKDLVQFAEAAKDLDFVAGETAATKAAEAVLTRAIAKETKLVKERKRHSSPRRKSIGDGDQQLVKTPELAKQDADIGISVAAKALDAINAFPKMLKVAKELTKLAPDVGKNTERYEEAKDKVLQLADPSKRESLGALTIHLFSERQGSKSEVVSGTDVGAKHVIDLAKCMIDAFSSMCSNPKTVDLACLLGEQLRVGLGVLSVLKLEEDEKLDLLKFKHDSLSKLKLTQRNASRKLKSSKLPLNGLNFILGCLQVGVEGLDASELKDAGKNAAKAVGSILQSIAMMKVSDNLVKNTKSLFVSGMNAALQRKAAKVSDQIFTDSALEHNAALAISAFVALKPPAAKASEAVVLPYMVLVQYVQGLVYSSSALPCIDTVNSLPRWEIVCSTVDLLGNLLQHKDIKKYPQLCQWLWDAHPVGNNNGRAVQSTEGNDFSFQGLSFFLTYGDESVQKQLGTQSMLVKQIVEWAKGLLIPDSVGNFNFKDKIEDLFALLSEALEDMIQKIKNGIVTMANGYVVRVADTIKKGLHKSAVAACFGLDRLGELCEKTTKLLEPLISVIEKASDVLMQLAGAKKFKIKGREITMKEFLLDQQKKKIEKALGSAEKTLGVAVKRTAIVHLEPKLRPYLTEQRFQWSDVLPVLEMVSIEDLKGAMENPTDFLVRIMKAVAIAILKPLLTSHLEVEGLEWSDVLPVLEEMDSADELKEAAKDPKGLLMRLATASGPAAKKLAKKRVETAGGSAAKKQTITAKASKVVSKTQQDEGDHSAAGGVVLQVQKKVIQMLQKAEAQESAVFDNATDMFSALPAVKKAQDGAIKVAHVMITVGETLKQVWSTSSVGVMRSGICVR
jgi:hypothetical protein